MFMPPIIVDFILPHGILGTELFVKKLINLSLILLIRLLDPINELGSY